MAFDFVAGCLGGCAGVLVGHPFDTVKVHLQMQDVKNPVYRGTLHCISTLIRTDGVGSLYRGMSSPLMGISVVNAIVFGVYGNVQRQMPEHNTLHSHLLAGAVSGFAQSIACSPMELAKTRMQLQHLNPKAPQFQSPFKCIRHIIATDGFKGAFRGLGMTALRDVPGFSAYFVSYEWLMSLREKPNVAHALIAGGLAGIASWLVCYPIDVIKTLLQADGMHSAPVYKGAWNCAVKNYQKDGLRFFFRGFTSTIIRAFPANAACFYVVAWILGLAKHTSLNVELQTADPLAIASVHIAVDMPLSYLHKYERERQEVREKRSTMVRILQTLGAFNEAVCQSDIEELASEFYPENDNDFKYYVFEDERLTVKEHFDDKD
ncbi:PREDICTED: mitochondrial basic amino acids transporter isoform X1 [Rhagoletis zephyria]|uniref:mitochondrial basic amino acids transporter isoform X1 n=2 Tax=Rhagoletis zephyria TaxID=28612 RepID=UPI0008117968|nr:PREDICTED: mitochondrial basic amino acids transporter isoform X1 [Rhagoletis zephyria]XP_017485328.1 PREDICTED: mitochondrial basic amino acids transporter isoform X1 [Rhagoletis zephyria]XP_017485335.1 PREDICTED: mitochondrial basic amino acids transporter isoform X1 [Rhagoletis zephyria]XP_017485341.1 PREDICTED: mitochondrial basic amino acids transporter isoform X1 [Rhagoletis zephyria]